jgi:tetracycline repressor-like protein
LLSTRGEPVLTAAADIAATHYRELAPGLDEAATALLSETVVRLAPNHLVPPIRPAAEAADVICAAVAPFLAHHSSTME